MTVNTFSVTIDNAMIDGQTVKHVHELAKREFTISRICRTGARTTRRLSTDIPCCMWATRCSWWHALPTRTPSAPCWNAHRDGLGTVWQQPHHPPRAAHALVGAGQEHCPAQHRSSFGVNITSVHRSGVDLMATPALKLQMGDNVTVVGSELGISHVEKMLGTSAKRYSDPNLIPIFLGLVLGCVLANVPFMLPGISETLRLGLTGGPLVIAMLIGYFGPKYNFVNYSTMSANLMLREVGLYLFLACIGLGTGKDFVTSLATPQGLQWIGYGLAITMIPILIGGLIGRLVFHINYFTLLGVLAGANTNSPALAYANDLTQSDSPAVGYATVYTLRHVPAYRHHTDHDLCTGISHDDTNDQRRRLQPRTYRRHGGRPQPQARAAAAHTDACSWNVRPTPRASTATCGARPTFWAWRPTSCISMSTTTCSW
jgi:putative transport protein